MKKLLITAAFGTLAITAFAVQSDLIEKSIPLKDGSTVYILKDGKMAMENKYGRPDRMKEGHVMETKDGQKIIMFGDEVSVLTSIKHINHGG